MNKAAGALLALLAFWTFLPQAARLSGSSAGIVTAEAVDMGEALRHAATPPGVDVTWRMPLGGLTESWLAVHSRSAGSWAGLGVAALALLAFSLGAFLGGTTGGLFALILVLWEWSRVPVVEGYWKMYLYGLFLLLAAAALARRARKPSVEGDASFVAAVGAGLLHRTPLVFFPALLALKERKPRSAAVLLLGPLLFLAPWLWLNARLHGEFVPLERGAPNLNLVSAVAGLDAVADGDQRLLMDVPPASATAPVVGWAMRKVLADPAAYLKGFARRVAFALSQRPLLCLAALVFILANIERPGVAECGLLALYYLLITCSMAVHALYFEPLWLLLAALLAGAAAPWAAPRALPRAAEPILIAGLAASVAAAIWAGGAAVLFAERARAMPPASRAAVEAALLRHPDDPWLIVLRGRHMAAEGEHAAALADYERAEALRPGNARVPLERAWAKTRAGDAAALESLPPFARADLELERRAALAAAAALAGRKEEAASELAAVAAVWRGEQKVPEGRTAADRAAERRLRDGSEGGAFHALKDAVALRGPDALLSLAKAADPRRTPALARLLALEYQFARSPKEALPVFERLAAAAPKEALILKDLGVCAFLAGEKMKAVAALEKAAALKPDSREIADSLAAAKASR